MKTPLKTFIALIISLLMTAATASALTGRWCGSLEYGQSKIPLVFNFTEDAEGKTGCTLDSPLQGAKGIPATVILCSADSVAVECGMIGAKFNASVSKDKIAGIFSQRGMNFGLTLTPELSIEERRPQTPRPPYPYTVIDTVFTSTDGTVMAATLTLPAGLKKGSKVPAVVMVSGSGPQNRDEEIMEHKPFAVIADHLARKGVASLRYDDRGTGKSKGNFNTSTTYTFQEDAKAALDFLRSLPQSGKTGILGHSEGGTIAFMLGAERKPDFIISLAGMAEPAKETMLRQNSRALDKAGIDRTVKESCMTLIGRLFDTIEEQNRRGVSAPVDIDSLVRATDVDVPDAIRAMLVTTQRTRTPWFDTVLSINPAESLAKIKCPMLALNGDKDTQVDAEANTSIIKKKAPKAEVIIFPSLNHLMQHAETGDFSEYGEIRETIAPEVLEAISGFANRQR